jgi:hypothetical protein
MFGVKQQRILVVNEPDGAGRPGRLQICTGAGKVKRDLELSEIKGVEEAVGIKDAEDADRAVSFRFFGSTSASKADKSEDRTMVFVSNKQRDAFLGVMEAMSKGIVVRKADGSLGSSEKGGAKAGGAGGASGGGSSKKKGGKGGLDLDALGSGAKFFAMEENDWGYAEPRVLTFNEAGSELRVIDATSVAGAPGGGDGAGGGGAKGAGAGGNADHPLRRLVKVALHLGDKSIAQLSFSDGGLLQTVSKTAVLSFGDRANRERFIEALREKLAGLAVVPEYDELWHGSLPTKQFVRFEATKVRAERAAVAESGSDGLRIAAPLGDSDGTSAHQFAPFWFSVVILRPALHCCYRSSSRPSCRACCWCPPASGRCL